MHTPTIIRQAEPQRVLRGTLRISREILDESLKECEAAGDESSPDTKLVQACVMVPALEPARHDLLPPLDFARISLPKISAIR